MDKSIWFIDDWHNYFMVRPVIKYKTTPCSISISAIEVLRDTPTHVILKGGGREAKESKHHNYHNSWKAAQAYLIDREWAAIEIYSKKLDEHRIKLDNIKELEPF